MRNETNHTNQLALDTYLRRAADNTAMLDLIRTELKAHADQTDQSQMDWNRTGDIGYVRNGLIELLMFISGRDRLDIEQYLDQTRPPQHIASTPQSHT